MGLLAHHRDAMGAVAQRAKPRHVVGMQMGIHRLDQPEVELAHELEVAVDPLQYRIDDQRLAAVPAGEQIGVGAGRLSNSWRKIMHTSARTIIARGLAEGHNGDRPAKEHHSKQ